MTSACHHASTIATCISWPARPGPLYLGVTNDLERRFWQHRTKAIPGFSARHGTTRLVWFEWFTRIDDAVAAEKRIKGWRREKKLALIEANNPQWWDLSRDWGI
jgi:putative endonuclease